MHQKQFYVGVDWASQSHHVCVLQAAGDRLGEQVFKHTGEGLARMAGWILKLAQSEPELVQVAIEVPHGPVVESLLNRGFQVHSINPRQLDRFRDRFSPAGAKDDSRDALCLPMHCAPTPVVCAVWNRLIRSWLSCASGPALPKS